MRPGAVIVDYGIGNLLSVSRALEHCGANVAVSADAKVIQGADRLVLPGVGAFGDCVQALEETGLEEPVRAFIATLRPFLGICVGMQMLFDESEEFGCHTGLGVIPGRVAAIPATRPDGSSRKVPHIGWSTLERPPGGRGWEGTALHSIRPGESVYYVHTYSALPRNPADCLAVSDYLGATVAGAVQRDNLLGCQFHPEKSGPVGLRIIAGFLET